MNRLKTIATWKPLIPQLKNLHYFYVIIQALSTSCLCQHYEDINHDHNFQMFPILFYKNKKYHSSTNVHKFINSLTYSYISIHDGQCDLMMINDIHMHLNSFNIIINDGLEYITTTFNINTRKAIHIARVYKAHSCLVSTFLNNLQIIFNILPNVRPLVAFLVLLKNLQ